MELIYSLNPNVIHYDTDVIQFHGIKETDGKGNIIGTNNKPAKEITNILQKLKSDIGKTFKIIPPRVIQLQRDLDFTANKKRSEMKFQDIMKCGGEN